ncbi:uncharacterized protein [Parasteatoda tepidariorum]|uniref:uncharacterized protein isoform X2 n=1 Tax=Parasteatoda tepidariorum TaxID=114398 RepID=UPI0039BC2326
MNTSFKKVRHELSLKMYTEDFITATEPIRNRIKAMLYEQERIKEIALAHLLPDAPGVLKCFSCKRGANLAGRTTVVPAADRRQFNVMTNEDAVRDDDSLKCFSVVSGCDLLCVPIPSPDKPRIQDPTLLPVLFARATPHVGLAHEKRRKQIDQELENYFASGGIRKGYTSKGNINKNTK